MTSAQVNVAELCGISMGSASAVFVANGKVAADGVRAGRSFAWPDRVVRPLALQTQDGGVNPPYTGEESGRESPNWPQPAVRWTRVTDHEARLIWYSKERSKLQLIRYGSAAILLRKA